MNEKFDFVFFFDNKVKSTHDKKEALHIFRKGGFYEAVCYFTREHAACFRILNNEEDIKTLN